MEEKIEFKVGQEVEGEIASLAYGGDGILRTENFVLFVPDVIPGEKVRVKISDLKRTFGRAELITVMEPSADRITPPCPVYGRCGGCQYQHIRYERTLAIKHQQLQETFQHLAGIGLDAGLGEITPCSKPYGYRDSLTLRVQFGRSGFQLGYTSRNNTSFVLIDSCPLASQAINQSFPEILEEIATQEASGHIEEVTIKESEGKMYRFYHYKEPYRFQTREKASFQLNGLKITYGLQSFFQVNHGMVPLLIEKARQLLRPTKNEVLFDFYAGSGLFSLALAGDYERVVGLEINYEALNCFRENVQSNQLSNVIALGGRVETRVGDVFKKNKGAHNVLILDPPRGGLTRELINELNRLGFEKILYVSCEASTLARDLKQLSAGYSIREIQSLDMFPQTKYFETMVLLRRIEHSA